MSSNFNKTIVQMCPSDSMAFEYSKLLYYEKGKSITLYSLFIGLYVLLILFICWWKDDTVSCIDCLFDMLDFIAWKNENKIWTFFETVLTNSKKYWETGLAYHHYFQSNSYSDPKTICVGANIYKLLYFLILPFVSDSINAFKNPRIYLSLSIPTNRGLLLNEWWICQPYWEANIWISKDKLKNIY